MITQQEAYWANDAIMGSLRLRDAIFRAFGHKVPSPVGRPKKVPTFKATNLGRPLGSENKIKPYCGKIEQIKGIVSQHSGLSVVDIIGPNKSAKFSRPRQLAMYAARKATGFSYPVIAHQFGDRDHTTVLHAIRAVEKRIEDGDEKTINALHAISETLGA